MIYLRAIKRIKPIPGGAPYPLSTSLAEKLDRLDFTSSVTIFSGENGSGKTTLLELIARKLNAVRIDRSAAAADSVKLSAFAASESYFRIEQGVRPRNSFFFLAEDFIKYISSLNAMKQEALKEAERVRSEYPAAGRSKYALDQALSAPLGTLAQLESMYENDISQRSHGESFIDFFSSRIIKGGIYLLDEPEAALSVFNQLVFLNIIAEAEKADCQLIIATHSPIITAYPGAEILQFEDGQARHVEYDDMESIRLLRAFMKNREGFLRDLKNDDR